MDDRNATVYGLLSTVCFAGVMARGESLRGRNSAFEPREGERQVEGMFDALLAQTMDGGR